LLSNFTTLLLYYFTTLLLYYFITLLLYNFTTLLLYYFTTFLLIASHQVPNNTATAISTASLHQSIMSRTHSVFPNDSAPRPPSLVAAHCRGLGCWFRRR